MKKMMQRDFIKIYSYETCREYLKLAYEDLQKCIAKRKVDVDGLKGLRYVIFVSEYNVPIDGDLYKAYGVSVKRPNSGEGDGDPDTLLAATEPQIDMVVDSTWPVDEEHDYDKEIDAIMAGTFVPTDRGWDWAEVDESNTSEYGKMRFTFLLYYER